MFVTRIRLRLSCQPYTAGGHPRLLPVQPPDDSDRQRQSGHDTNDVQPQVVATGLTEQRHGKGRQAHGEDGKGRGDDQRAAPGLLAIGFGAERNDLE